MSRPKSAGAYATVMLDLMDQLTENPKDSIEIFFPTKAQAMSFRLEFYSFRKAAIREGMESLYPELKAVEIQVSDDGVATVSHKDHTKTAQIVADALELAKQKTLQRSADSKSAKPNQS